VLLSPCWCFTYVLLVCQSLQHRLLLCATLLAVLGLKAGPLLHLSFVWHTLGSIDWPQHVLAACGGGCVCLSHAVLIVLIELLVLWACVHLQLLHDTAHQHVGCSHTTPA
jgi:hypothetical protein